MKKLHLWKPQAKTTFWNHKALSNFSVKKMETGVDFQGGQILLFGTETCR